MMHSKISNLHKSDLSGTPQRILYHAESRLMLVLRNCMELLKAGGEQVLVVGTSTRNVTRYAPATGRLIVLYLENCPEGWDLRLASSTEMDYEVSAICPFLDRCFVAASKDMVYVFSIKSVKTGTIEKLAGASFLGNINTLATHLTTIAAFGNFYSEFLTYIEDSKKFGEASSCPRRKRSGCLPFCEY